MFDRYRALFALRNRGGAAVAPLLAEVLESSGSALLKHEVCYVLGQLQEPEAAAALERTLADRTQHAMVRHEAAEALGSIAGPEGRERLEQYAADADPVVAEGCLVALDILEYEQSGAFEYCVV
jgi:deoxyhypusine monooxygenase